MFGMVQLIFETSIFFGCWVGWFQLETVQRSWGNGAGTNWRRPWSLGPHGFHTPGRCVTSDLSNPVCIHVCEFLSIALYIDKNLRSLQAMEIALDHMYHTIFVIFQGQGILPPPSEKKEQGDVDREFSWIFQNRICNQKNPTKTCKESNVQKNMLRLPTAREKSVVSRDKKSRKHSQNETFGLVRLRYWRRFHVNLGGSFTVFSFEMCEVEKLSWCWELLTLLSKCLGWPSPQWKQGCMLNARLRFGDV